MVDRYYRKIESVGNNVKSDIQISSILLKLKEYDEIDLPKIENNKNDITNNQKSIYNNKNDVAKNKKLIQNNENNVTNNKNDVTKNEKSIYDNQNNISNNKNDIANNKKSIHSNKNDIVKNEKSIQDNKNDITDLNSFTNNNKKNINEVRNYILNLSKNFEYRYDLDKLIFNFNNSKHFYTIIEKEIEYDFTINSLLYIQSYVKYDYYDLANNYFRLQHEYNIFDNNDNLLHKYLFNNDTFYDSSKQFLNTKESFYISFTQNYPKIKIVLTLHRQNRLGKGVINLKIDNGFLNVDYIDKNNSQAFKDNKNDIDNIKDDVHENKKVIVNIKDYYHLSDIYIYDIKATSQNVSYTDHFHIFEKEIINNFKKDEYLEIILKVLTEISNYIMIGFFEVLCNFYDDDEELFYTISLSTAAGSINKLSTIKSVFLVKIKNDTNKIKIDFFIKPKESQKNRNVHYKIIDINSNKIYIKYYK